MVKIWHISDTHGFHRQLPIVIDADIVIHSGDVSNTIIPDINANEIFDFLNWFSQLPIPHKIFVPGNHDYAMEIRYIPKEDFINRGITVLINESVEINNIKFWGSPYTPRLKEHYIHWAWGLPRGDMEKVWSLIPADTDVLITHGPPHGILDLCSDYEDRDRPAQAGDKILLNKIREINPKMHLFGHIHDEKSYVNSCILQKGEFGTIFSNASCAGRTKLQLVNHGNILNISGASQ